MERRPREEILDTRAPRGPERRRPEPQELPPVELDPSVGQVPPGVMGAHSSTGPLGWPWRRWVAVSALAAFVAGAAVGGTTVGAQRDAASAAGVVDDARVAAVVLGLDGVGRQGVLRIGIGLRNMGDGDLRLVSLYPDGWVVVEDGRQDVRLPEDRWVNATMLVVPACDGPVPAELVARVANGERERLLRLPLPTGENPLAWARQEACSPAEAEIVVTSVDVLGESGAGLRSRLVLRGGSRPATEVTGVSSRTPGFAVAVESGLPATVRGGGLTTYPVVVAWQVTDCTAAASLGSADIAFEVAADAGDLAASVQSLDPRITAALARYAVGACAAEVPVAPGGVPTPG